MHSGSERSALWSVGPLLMGGFSDWTDATGTPGAQEETSQRCMKGTPLAPVRTLSIDLSAASVFKTSEKEEEEERETRGDLGLRDVMKNSRRSECFIDQTRLTRPLEKHLGLLKAEFNGIDFYCSASSVKSLTVLLTGYRHILLNTERKKTFHFSDLIHQTMCALNFDKLPEYKPHCTQLRSDIRHFLFLCLFYSFFLQMPLMSQSRVWDVARFALMRQMLGPQQPVEASHV